MQNSGRQLSLRRGNSVAAVVLSLFRSGSARAAQFSGNLPPD